MAKRTQTTRVVLGISSFIIQILLTILFYVIVVMLIMKYSGMAFDFAYEVFGNVQYSNQGELGEQKDVVVTINKGESTMSVASKLELNRVIPNKYSFYLRAKIFQKNIKTGRYVVNTGMNYDQILDTITDYDNNVDKDKEETTDKK